MEIDWEFLKKYHFDDFLTVPMVCEDVKVSSEFQRAFDYCMDKFEKCEKINQNFILVEQV